MLNQTARWAALAFVITAVGCGKPVDRSGNQDGTFVAASMAGTPAPTGADRPLASDLAVEPISMLVMFNRLKTADALEGALNKRPGQFSHLDLDKDNVPDALTVAMRDTDKGHAFEIRARPNNGEFVVATLIFDPEWTFLGHYNGALNAASTHGRPLMAENSVGTPAAPQPTPVATLPPPPSAAGADVPPTPEAAPVAGGVQAVPAHSDEQAGLLATP